LGYLGYAYARSGEKDQALRTLSELQELEKRSGSGGISYDLALWRSAVAIGMKSSRGWEKRISSPMMTVCYFSNTNQFLILSAPTRVSRIFCAE